MIQHERVERAKSLLTTTDLPVALIAERCGYQSNERLTVNFRAFRGRASGDLPPRLRGKSWLDALRRSRVSKVTKLSRKS